MKKTLFLIAIFSLSFAIRAEDCPKSTIMQFPTSLNQYSLRILSVGSEPIQFDGAISYDADQDGFKIISSVTPYETTFDGRSVILLLSAVNESSALKVELDSDGQLVAIGEDRTVSIAHNYLGPESGFSITH